MPRLTQEYSGTTPEGSGTSSQRDSSTRQNALEAQQERIARLVEDHIPHFKHLFEKKSKRKRGQQGGNIEVVADSENAGAAAFVNSSTGFISEGLVHEAENLIKDKAYKDIQEARGHNTSTAYCGKQVEYLMFCEDFYARRPLAARFLATSDGLISFLYQKVCFTKNANVVNGD